MSGFGFFCETEAGVLYVRSPKTERIILACYTNHVDNYWHTTEILFPYMYDLRLFYYVLTFDYTQQMSVVRIIIAGFML